MDSWSGPSLIGGDFNLVRNSAEKNTGSINQNWANLFNDWINKFSLMELVNAGRKFTWANNQDNLVMVTLDRIFITTCWDMLYPSSLVKSLARVGSDHTPLVVDTGTLTVPRQKQFRFEKWWLKQDGFDQEVIKNWSNPGRSRKAINIWQFKVRNFRKFAKGWSANIESAQHKKKQQLIAEYDLLDILSETDACKMHT